MKCISRLAQSGVRMAACLSLVALSAVAHADLVTGNGEWESQSSVAMRGTWTVTLERSGGTLKGIVTLTGSLLFSGAQVTGTMQGDQLMFGTVVDASNQLTFSGTFVDEHVTGDWHSDTTNDSGSWSGMLHAVVVDNPTPAAGNIGTGQ